MKKKYLLVFVIFIVIMLGFCQSGIYAAKANSTKATNTLTEEEKAERENKYLSSLKIEGYELSPEFNKNTLEYYVIIPKSCKELEIDATAEIEEAVVRITGNNNLTKQENNISIRVTAIDGTSRVYNITAIKEPEVKLQLDSLEIEGIDLSPVFKKDTYYYTASLEDTELRSLKVNAVADNSDARIEILGADNIIDGNNLISIIVSDKSDTTIYQVDVDIDFLGEKEKERENVITRLRKIINYVVIGVIIFVCLIILIIIISVIVKKNKKANKKKTKKDFENF